jgi:hypothetical protein
VGTLTEGTIPVTRRECRELMEQRLAALSDAVGRDTLLPELPARDRSGYKAFLRLYGRHRDGSLSASVVIERPGYRQRYRRTLRIVTGEPKAAERPVHLRGARQ